MRTSQNGIDLIKKFEGCKLQSYKCPAGALTIGFGHTGSDVKNGMKITQEQADEYLKQDLKRFERAVNNLNLPLNQNQFDALVSFTYNCGPGNLKTLVKNRSLAQIADALLLYNKSNGVVLNGLVKRRKAEQNLFLKQNIKQKYNVRASALNIRAGAGVKYKIIGVLKKDTVISLSTASNGWGKLSDDSGWVSMAYLDECK